MPVTNQVPRNVSTAAPGATLFPYAFKVLHKSHLQVTVDGVGKTVDVDFTVSGVGLDAGGDITFLTPMVGGERVMRRRWMPFERSNDFQNLGDLRSATLNNDQDAPVMMLQQLRESDALSIKLPADSTASGQLPAIQPLRPLVGNAAGDGFEFGDTTLTGDMLLRPNLAAATDNLFKQSDADAVNRGIVAKLRETVSPEDFGAMGDGVTDDTAVIQKALDAGRNLHVTDGKTYVVQSLTVTVPGTRVYGGGTFYAKDNVDGQVLRILADGVTVEGIRIDCTGPKPTDNQANDAIRLESVSGCIVRGCSIEGAKGGGICLLNSSKNLIEGNRVSDVHDNGIFVADVGSDDNTIIGNTVDGTGSQNGIFITASSGSLPTSDFIYRNRIIGNTVRNCTDTCIEAGIHSVDTIIMGNTAENSLNPEILLRDVVSAVVIGNVTKGGPGGSALHDGIALLEQTETAWGYRTVIAGNHVTGRITRGGIMLQGANSVLVEGNRIEETYASVNPTTGAGLTGAGICLASDSSDVVIRGNVGKRLQNFIDTNLGGSAGRAHTRMTIADNDGFDVDAGLSLYDTDFTNSSITNNRIRSVVSRGVDARNSTGGGNSYCFGNTIQPEGFSGASPVRFDGRDWQQRGFLTSASERRLLVPETQYAQVEVQAVAGRSVGTVSIEFEDGAEGAVFAVSRADTAKLAGSANLLDSTGSAGFSGWALFYDGGNNLILQRRGNNTGAGARYMRVRFSSLNES